MTSVSCRVCGDLNLADRGPWPSSWYSHRGDKYAEVCNSGTRQLKDSAETCPSGGCAILLRAVARYAPRALDVEYTPLYNVSDCSEVAFEVGYNESIQLFKTEGMSYTFVVREATAKGAC